MSEWQPIETAPKDGTDIRARGRNWGSPLGEQHQVIARWDNGWHSPDGQWFYRYLDEWQPLPPEPPQ